MQANSKKLCNSVPSPSKPGIGVNLLQNQQSYDTITASLGICFLSYQSEIKMNSIP